MAVQRDIVILGAGHNALVTAFYLAKKGFRPLVLERRSIVGGAAITTGGELKARYVIHAASMELGGRTDALSLRSSTAHSLRIAAQRKLKTIAFPAVGTGIAGFPMRECAEIMLREVAKHFEGPTSLEKVSFVLFDKDALHAFQRALDEMKDGAAAP